MPVANPMILISKIQAARNALNASFSNDTHPTEAKSFIHHADLLLDQMINMLDSQVPTEEDLSVSLQESRIAVILTGSLINALVTSQHHQFTPDQRYYPKTSAELFKICEMEEVIQIVDLQHYSVRFVNVNNPIYNAWVNRVGLKILHGELPFDIVKMKELFPSMSEHLDCIQSRISNTNIDNVVPFPTCEEMLELARCKKKEDELFSDAQLPPHVRINKLFEDAIAACKENPANDGEYKKVFIMQLKKLQQETLKKHYPTHKKSTFNTDNCLLLASHALQLATKVGDGSIEASDCQYFADNTKVFKGNHIIATILSAIVGAVTGMILGATCGFLVAGIMGAAIGAGIGFFTSGIAATSLAKISQHNTDHRALLLNSAKEIVNQPRLMV